MPQEQWINDPILAGASECAALMRGLDWNQSPLGPPAGWPLELRTLVSVMLPALQPMFICWGPEQIMLYNDPYSELCGARHPKAMGQRFRELWFDIWEQVKPIVDAAYAGIGTQMDDIQLTMYRNGHPEETHFSFSYTPVRSAGHAVLGFFCACTETTHLVAARNRQQSEIARLTSMFRQAPGGIAILEGEQQLFTHTNAAFDKIADNTSLLGKPLADVATQEFAELARQVFRTGEPHVGRSLPYSTSETSSPRYLDFVLQPIEFGKDEARSIFVLAQDVSERVEAEKQQATRNRELVHRLKNQLSMVQAIIGQSFRTAADADTAQASITNRIGALARAHDLLLHETAGTTSLLQLIHSVRDTHDDRVQARMHMQGPDLRIAPRPALSLALILHELSTNAAKYGSLSVPGGSVQVNWSVQRMEDKDHFELEWREQGGPSVSEPERKGTGSRLIQAGISGVSWSEVEMDFDRGGLCCRIATSLEDLAEKAEP